MSAPSSALRTPDPQLNDAGSITRQAVLNQLDFILASQHFSNSLVLSRFLRYVVEQTLAGDGELLKEYRIGVDVFGRKESFDPRLESVVRSTAQRMRVRLTAYYENEGRGDPIRIDIPKGGYATVFTAIPPASARPALYASSGLPDRDLGREWSWRQVFTAAFALVLIAAAVLIYLSHRRRTAPAPESPSIVVLPFLNLTGEPDNEYFSDGLTDELTCSLGKVPGLRVVARTSAFNFKGRAQDVRAIGKQLNVSSALEGSVQRNGDRMRITAELIRTSDGSQLWAETYEATSKDTFVVEDKISRDLTTVLNTRMLQRSASDAREHSVDPVVHELYMRGRYMGARPGLDNLKSEISYFNQALDRDPLYAHAYAWLANAYCTMGANAWAAPAEVYPKARAAAERAKELDPDLPMGHAALANIDLFFNWDFAAAEKGFRRALLLNPNDASIRLSLGTLLLDSRRFDEAREQFRLAKQVNPLAVGIDLNMVMLEDAQHNYDRAIELDRNLLSEHDNYMGHLLLGFLYADRKQYKIAIEEGQKAVALAGEDADANLALANLYARAGERDQSLAIVHKFAESTDVFVPPITVAGVYAELGEREQMYQWLDKAIEQRSPACLKLNITEAFDAYRSEPRFQAMLRKIGLLR